MNDIRKYIKIIEQGSSAVSTDNETTNSHRNEVTKFVSLIESAMRVDESFKTAQEKFSEVNDDEQEVKQYIEKFKELAKRNIIKGQDKDIGKWIKAGWETFKGFVEESSTQQSKRQYKKKVKSDSITVYEDDDKIVIIPLSENASCYYGKNTQWCTAAAFSDNHFNNYFGGEEVTLFYVLMKNTGEKLAAARYPDGLAYEYFDENDNSIFNYSFEEETGIDSDQLDVWYEENRQHIEKARERFNPKGIIKNAVEKYESGEYNWSMAMAEINNQIHELDHNPYGIEISGVDGDGNFVVDIEFILEATESMSKYIDGEEHLDIYNPSLDYEYLFEHLEPEWQIHVVDYIRDNHLDEVQEILDDDEVSREDIENNLNEILENIDELDELKSAFRMAEEDGTRSEVEGNIAKSVSSFIEENCDKLHLSMNKPLFSLIDGDSTVPIKDNDVVSFVESIEEFELDRMDVDIDLGVMDYDHLEEQLKEHIGEAIGYPENSDE